MNQIRIVPISGNARCHACPGLGHWRVEAGYNRNGKTRTMRLCNAHRDELAEALFHHIFAESHGKHEKSLRR